jgi:hypothetical protein
MGDVQGAVRPDDDGGAMTPTTSTLIPGPTPRTAPAVTAPIWPGRKRPVLATMTRAVRDAHGRV